MSRPRKKTRPEAAVSRMMARSIVVLPAPLGPSTVTNSPSPTERLVGLSALTRPYQADRSRASISGGAPVGHGCSHFTWNSPSRTTPIT